MDSLQHIYTLSIFLFLIKFSMETCNLFQLQENPGNFSFMEDGSYIYEERTISLIRCANIAEINSTLFNDIKSKLNNIEDFRYLSLYGNGISSISGCGFENLSPLIYLNLSHNNIEMLPQSTFSNMVNLKVLDLSENKIKFVEENFMIKMDGLEQLYLQNNHISEINFLKECPKLKILDLSGNDIVSLSPHFLKSSPELVYLKMSHNVIQNFNVYFLPNLKFLDISNNELKTINAEATFPKLKYLDLGNNEFLFREKGLRRQNYVTTVLLFKNIPLLHTLILTNTGIESLEIGTFTGLDQLKILNLSHNNIRDLPNGIFYELTLLKKLYINNNDLRSFNYDYNFMLDEIDLNENPWDCRHLLELLKLMPNTKIIRGHPFDADGLRTNVYGTVCHEI